jgi:hypothetical protein
LNDSPANRDTTASSAPWYLRFLVILSALLSIAFFAASFFNVWWRMLLYAPQYPDGLMLDIKLTGMGGDVHEIDLLNHYIGMSHLANAAPTERALAGYGVAAICITVLALLMLAGKKLNKLVAVPAIAFPVVFLADSFFGLYKFGHELNPRAPIHLPHFTPQMFGNGKQDRAVRNFWLAPNRLLARRCRCRVCSRGYLFAVSRL